MPDHNSLNQYQPVQNIHRSSRFNLYRAVELESGLASDTAFPAFPAVRGVGLPPQVLIKTPDALRVNDAELTKQLLAEAAAHKALSHPRIRACYDSFVSQGTACMVGEYIPGKSLVRCLGSEEAPRDLDSALLWIRDLLEATEHAHSRGILHLGINPYNIIVDADRRLKLIGFGKPNTAYQHSEEDFSTYHPLLFVAPEVFQAGFGLPASDIYSCAVVAYLILCGVPPWRIDLQLSPQQQKNQSLTRAVIMPEILKKQVPDWLFAILLQCLKLDPQLRMKTSSEMLQAIVNRGVILDFACEPETLEPQPLIPEIAVPEPELSAPEEPEIFEPEAETHPEKSSPEAVYPEPLSQEPEAEPSFTELRDSLENEPVKPQEPESAESSSEEFIPIAVAEIRDAQPAEEDNAATLSPIPVIEPEPIALPAAAMPEYSKTPRLYQENSQRKAEENEKQEMGKMQKSFKVLLLLSLVVVLFVVVKYFVLDAKPKFSGITEAPGSEEPSALLTEPNQPIDMIQVPADTLIMGSISPEADDDEFPLLTIKIAPFYISTREITQAEWQMVFPNNPSQFKDKNLPVENVSFYDAIEFCNAKSVKDGYRPCYDYYDTEVVCSYDADGYRLPTEAEWEFAAKSAQPRYFHTYSGGEVADDVGWHNGNSSAHSHPGALKTANQLGIYDLSGNLYEWVWNWYAPYSYRVDDPFIGPNSGTDKVIRGGSWYNPPADMRVTNRSYAKPYTKNGFIGFRVVRVGL